MGRGRITRFFVQIAFWVAFTSLFNTTQGQIITAFAGNGIITRTGITLFSGDGGPATLAGINKPMGIAIDTMGNLFFSDGNNYRVRKVDRNGIISTYAGNGSLLYSGDGGPATSAGLFPYDLATDKNGNVYFTDGVVRIRKINRAGIISTFAGTGFCCYSGDGGPATLARISFTVGLATDRFGNVYFSDTTRIRKIDTLGIITTIAGNGLLGTGGDGGPATLASLYKPSGLAIDPFGNIFISDDNNNKIRKINAAGIISTFAGTGVLGFSGDGGPALLAQLDEPLSLSTDAFGNLYVCDANNYRIRKINTSGIITTIAGDGAFGVSGDGGPATAAQVNPGIGIAIGKDSSVYFSDNSFNLVRKITYNNHPPSFTGGHSQNFTVCENSGPDSVNALLSITDPDTGQTETWGAWAAPHHGTLVASAVRLSTGVVVTPSGITYKPTPGYAGADSFKIYATDGFATDTTTIHVTILRAPGPIIGASHVCAGAIINLADTSTGATWSSGAPLVAAVVGSGIVVGEVAGTTIVSYTFSSGCAATLVVTVNASPGAISGGLGVCRGGTGVFTDSISGGAWSSSNTAIATVGSAGLVSGVSVGTTILTYALTGGCIATKTISVSTVPLTGTITGAATVCTTDSIALSNAAAGGVWGSPSGGVMVNPANGTVTGLSAGTATISYTVTNGCGSASATHAVTVNVSPNAGTISGPNNVCQGSAITLSDAAGGGSWSGTAGLVSVGSSSGIITGVSAGTATISYRVTNTCGTATATQTIGINPLPLAGTISGPAAVCPGASITLTDPSPGGSWSATNGNASIAAGTVSGNTTSTDTILYTVTNSCGTATATTIITISPLPFAGTITGPASVCVGASLALGETTSGGVWSTALGHATVISGVVSGVSAGTDTIKYSVTNSCGTATALKTMTINPLPLVGSITGPTLVCTGSSITLSDGISGGSWSADNGNATVSGGVVTGIAAGTDAIYYSMTNICGTLTASAFITINLTPGPIGGITNACLGLRETLTDSLSGGLWSATNFSGSVALDSFLGTIRGVTAGTAMVSYTMPTGCLAMRSFAINPVPASITGTFTACQGQTTTLHDSTTGGSWTSGNTAIATIGSTGILTGVSGGSVQISYTLNGCPATALVSVNRSPMPITGPDSVCAFGSTIRLHDADSAIGTWTSIYVTVDSIGVVTSFAAGIGIISFTLASGCMVTKSITVNPLPANITGRSYACIGTANTYTDATSGGVWSASTGFATIGSATGMVTGTATGTTILTYTIPTGCATTKTIAVNPQPAPIMGATRVCAGSTTILTDSTTGGAWTSGNLAIATIGSASGTVRGIAAGTATITYSVTNACGASIVTHSLTINPLPNSGTITGPATVCKNGQITLADTATGGVWTASNGNATITAGLLSGIQPGQDTIQYKVSNICGTDSTAKIISILPLPQAGLITGSQEICLDSTTTLTDTAAGGAWSVGTAGILTANSATGQITGIAPGTDTVYYSVTNACGTSTANFPLTVSHTGICDLATPEMTPNSTTTLTIYPNPTKGAFTILLTSEIETQATLTILTPTGQKAAEYPIPTNTPTDLNPGLPAGVYFVYVSGEMGRMVVKLVVE